MSSVRHKPNDSRGFVHKRLFGAAVGFVTGGPAGAAAGFVRGGGSAPAVMPHQAVAFAGSGPCPSGFVRTARGCKVAPCPDGSPRNQATGRCGPTKIVAAPGFPAFVQRLVPGGATGLMVDPAFDSGPGAGPGEAVMGRFGAALEPTLGSGFAG